MRVIEYLFLRPGPAGPELERWGAALLGAYAGVAVAIVVLGVALRAFGARHGARTRIAQRIIGWGLALQLAGLLALGLRWLDAPIISLRIWLFLQLIAEVVAAGYLWWWLRARYPGVLAQYEWEDRKRAYLPRAAGGSVEPVRRKAPASRRR
jgi:hypothetical protein